MSTRDVWMLRLTMIAGIAVFVLFAPAVMFTLGVSDLWGATIPCALFLAFVRVVAAVDDLPANPRRLGQLVLLAAVGVALIVSCHLFGSANNVAERFPDIGLGTEPLGRRNLVLGSSRGLPPQAARFARELLRTDI